MKSVSVSPHVHSPLSTDKAMLYVAIALLPSAIWGVAAFGLRALLVLLVSVASSVIVEYIFSRISKEDTIRDFSARQFRFISRLLRLLSQSSLSSGRSEGLVATG